MLNQRRRAEPSLGVRLGSAISGEVSRSPLVGRGYWPWRSILQLFILI